MDYQTALAEEIRACAARLLAEDVGAGDITAQLIPENQWATAKVITREPAVLCGVAWVNSKADKSDMFTDSPGSISSTVCTTARTGYGKSEGYA